MDESIYGDKFRHIHHILTESRLLELCDIAIFNELLFQTLFRHLFQPKIQRVNYYRHWTMSSFRFPKGTIYIARRTITGNNLKSEHEMVQQIDLSSFDWWSGRNRTEREDRYRRSDHADWQAQQRWDIIIKSNCLYEFSYMGNYSTKEDARKIKYKK